MTPHLTWSVQKVRRLNDPLLYNYAAFCLNCFCPACLANQSRCVAEAYRRDKIKPGWSLQWRLPPMTPTALKVLDMLAEQIAEDLEKLLLNGEL